MAFGKEIVAADGAAAEAYAGQRKVRVSALYAIIAVASLLLSGCMADEAAPRPPTPGTEGSSHAAEIARDSQGDATEWNSGAAQQHVRRCPLLGPAEQHCRESSEAALQHVPNDAGGVPAHPSLDLLAVRIAENATTITVEVEVAHLEDEFAGVVTGGGDPAYWEVGWMIDDERWVGVFLPVARPNGVLKVDPILGLAEDPDSCGYLRSCLWIPEWEIVPGTPGTVRWHVPRAAVPGSAEGDTISGFWALAVRGSWQVDRGLQWRVGDPSLGLIGGENDFRRWYVSDRINIDAEYTFQTPLDEASLTEHARGGLDQPQGDLRTDVPRPDLDILRVEIREDPTHVEIATQLGRVDKHVTEPMWGWTGIALSTGPYADSGFDRRGDVTEHYSGACARAECTYGETPIHVETRFEYGEPGWIIQAFPRDTLGSPKAGDIVAYAASWTGTSEGSETAAGGGAPASVSRTMSGDWAQMMPLYIFQYDTAATGANPAAGNHSHSMSGVAGDATLPETARASGADPARFDITGISVNAADHDRLVLTLEVADLDQIIVPSGYRGVLYATAVELPTGRFMAGYYKGEGELGSVGFFCAPDTAVLAAEAADPHNAAWQPISGTSSAPASPDAPGGGGNSLSFVVPHSPCLSPEPLQKLEVLDWAGATFLVGGTMPGEEIVRVDEVVGGDPFTVQAADVATGLPAAPWYDDPFGIRAFWDILGLAFAAALALGGALLWRRRRALLRWYLAELQRCATAYAKRPHRLEEALVDLRGRSRKDLERDRLRDEHFVLIENRIESELSRARLGGLEDIFGDLPHRLLMNLKEMLADGALSQRDYRTLSALLDESPLERAAKVAMRERLARWLEEDNGRDIAEHVLVKP